MHHETARNHNLRAATGYYAFAASVEPAERLERAGRLTDLARHFAWAALRHHHPDAGEGELRWRFTALLYGKELAERSFGPRPGAPG